MTRLFTEVSTLPRYPSVHRPSCQPDRSLGSHCPKNLNPHFPRPPLFFCPSSFSLSLCSHSSSLTSPLFSLSHQLSSSPVISPVPSSGPLQALLAIPPPSCSASVHSLLLTYHSLPLTGNLFFLFFFFLFFLCSLVPIIFFS